MSHIALLSWDLLQIALLNASSQAILSWTIKRCLPTSQFFKATTGNSLWGALCCLPLDKVSHTLAVIEESTVFIELRGAGVCESSPWTHHILCDLLVKERIQEAVKHKSPGAWATDWIGWENLLATAVYTHTDIFLTPKWAREVELVSYCNAKPCLVLPVLQKHEEA